MFYDERIESVKGRISRNAILISFVVSVVLCGVHLANIIRNAPNHKCYWFVVLEIAICAGCALVLLLGFVRGKLQERDERTEAAQSAFYNRAARALILFVMGVFALTLPVVLYLGRPSSFADGGFDGILYVLFFIVGIYVVYGFRHNDIYFNYSIMESECYYKGVFKNLGKLGLLALAFLGISAISLMGVVALESPEPVRVLKICLHVIAYYVGTCLELAILYLLYSFLEKCSYNSENAISKSTILSLGITIFIYAAYAASMIFVYATAITQASAALLSSILSTLDTYIKFALLIFLTYFGYEYQRVRKNRLLSAACITILLGETLAVLARQISGGMLYVFMPELMQEGGYVINEILAMVNVSVEDASTLADAVGLVLVIFALVKDKLIHRAHRFAIVAFAAFGGLEVFLRTQIDVLEVNIYHFIVEIIVLCYFAVLVACTAKRTKEIE